MTPEDDARILAKDPVFVTAFSDNHYDEAMKNLLPSFNQFFPNKVITVYNLGLTKDRLDIVSFKTASFLHSHGMTSAISAS